MSRPSGTAAYATTICSPTFAPTYSHSVRESRYRWAVLAAGVFAQAALSAVQQGLPAIAPVLRDELGLSLTQVGVVLASVSWGITALLLVWGWLADRAGERIVVSVGLGGGALALAAGAYASAY